MLVWGSVDISLKMHAELWKADSDRLTYSGWRTSYCISWGTGPITWCKNSSIVQRTPLHRHLGNVTKHLSSEGLRRSSHPCVRSQVRVAETHRAVVQRHEVATTKHDAQGEPNHHGYPDPLKDAKNGTPPI